MILGGSPLAGSPLGGMQAAPSAGPIVIVLRLCDTIVRSLTPLREVASLMSRRTVVAIKGCEDEMTHTIVFGTEEPQDFQLYDDGAAFDATGLTVSLVFRETVATPPTVAWLTQTASTVRVSGVENLPLGHYHVRFKLTDSGGLDGFAPNGSDPDHWIVARV